MTSTVKAGPDSSAAGRTLAERGIVAFGDVDWNGVWYSRHQILSRLARSAPVLVVGRPPELRDALSMRPIEPGGARRVADRLWGYNAPRFAPIAFRPPWLRRAAARLRAAHLRATWRRLGLNNPLYYVFLPEFERELEYLPPSLVCYHCYDKYDAYVGHDPEASRGAEQRLLARADLVVAASSALARDLADRGGRNVNFLPHAVDARPFAAAAGGPVPSDLETIPRPRIGYVARIDERIDVEALDTLASARPEWSIVIIGPASFQTPEGWDAWARLSARPNVHRLGGKEQSLIPAYIAGLDVGLLCYRRDNWGRWVQPIKAYEYIAAEKPVVSSDIEAASGFGDLVRVVRGATSWPDSVQRAIDEDNTEARARRAVFAAVNTWDERVGSLVRILEAAAARPGGAVRQPDSPQNSSS